MSTTIDELDSAARSESRAAKVTADREANMSWEIDRAAQSRRSEVKAWRISAFSMFIASIAVAAVFVQGPLRRVETVPLVVDKVTGETTIATKLDVDTIPAMDALDMHNATRFVRCREAYNWMFLQKDYDCVMRMAAPNVFGEYNKLFDGEESLDKKMGSAGQYRINIVHVRPPAQGRTGNIGESTVTFEKEIFLPNVAVPKVQRYVASLRFEYRPNMFEKQADRIENPFGFVVTAYRADPDLTESAATAKR